jgi:plastocyanin
MSSHDEKIHSGGGYFHMKGVALSILVMGVSLAAIIIAYVMFGHIGPSFSSERINVQQAELRKEYGLPVQEVIRNQSVLLTPPSLRDLNQTATSNATSTQAPNATSTQAPNATSTQATNATAPNATSTQAPNATSAQAPNATSAQAPNATSTQATNATVPNATSAQAPNATSAQAPNATSTQAPATAGSPGTPLTILEGSSIQGNPSYDPATLTVKKGDKITVTNKDTLPHTVTSGTGPTDPNSAKQFDTSIIEAGATADIETTNMNPAEYPFHCTVHPYMMGKLVVQ